jgi:2'-5' RNA ligase
VDAIQGIRDKYDPLAHCIAPHITVVFPFESDLTADELKSYIYEALRGVKKFRVILKNITGDFHDGYLFLNVKRGNDRIVELHDMLYSGILQRYLYRKVTYCPHLTVGKLNDAAEFDKAIQELDSFVESFETVADKVYVENIDRNGNSVIEFSCDLA